MILISVFIVKEYNADKFHKNSDRIHALQADNPFREGEKMYFIRNGAAEYMKDNYAEVEDFCRILSANPKKVKIADKDYFDESKVIAASSNFFDFFSYELLINSHQNMLQTEQDIVISDELAKKYFGYSNPLGQRLTLVNQKDENEMFVSGVFRKTQESTQLNFDMVKLIGKKDSRCYLLLAENTDKVQLEKKFSQYRQSIPIVNDGIAGTHYLKDLMSAYFDNSRKDAFEKSRDKADLMIALAIGLMILAVALFNYLGLTSNRLLGKTKVHAICIINGSSKSNLIANIITEWIILIGTAFTISLLLIITILPFFNQLTSSAIKLPYLINAKNILLIFGFPCIIMLITYLFAWVKIGKIIAIEGLYPERSAAFGRTEFPAFNIAQLAISVILIIGSIIILKQNIYIANKDIGLNRQVLEVRIPEQHKNISGVFKTELEKEPSVELVSITNASPVLEHFVVSLHYEDNGIKKKYTPAFFSGDQNYLKTLGIKVLDGNGFSDNAEANKNKCIINESLSKFFPGQNLIGHKLPGDNKIVIGIVKDFHYGSLKEFIEPGCITYNDKGYYLIVKPVPGQMDHVRKTATETWNILIKDFPVNIESLGDRYVWMHRENSNYIKLIGACCIISVFLSMCGLFAVSFHSSRQRIKEIGIRKVNGAKIKEVMIMLNKDFVKWVAIAFVFACPCSWYVMHKWLENFAYKTELSWWIFALAGLLAMGIALLTVSWQSWRAARRNPVEALRYE